MRTAVQVAKAVVVIAHHTYGKWLLLKLMPTKMQSAADTTKKPVRTKKMAKYKL